ncbi:MAG: hypothetical protein FJZ89_04865 [Chloroflexi bacterium]|nr:hypothetical protein [Chloroflexota bacterium]
MNRVVGIIVVLLVVAGLVALSYWAFATDGLNGLKNLAIVLLALETIVVTALLVVVVLLLARLVGMLQEEIAPVLKSVQQTASTVRGTTTFVSDTFVSPLIQIASALSGLSGTIKAVLGSKRKEV